MGTKVMNNKVRENAKNLCLLRVKLEKKERN